MNITQTTLLPPLCPFGQNNIEYVEEINQNVNIYLYIIYKHVEKQLQFSHTSGHRPRPPPCPSNLEYIEALPSPPL